MDQLWSLWTELSCKILPVKKNVEVYFSNLIINKHFKFFEVEQSVTVPKKKAISL